MSKLKLPITRYYGSKRKIISLIWKEISELNIEFDSVLDLFGGSGIFSYMAKLKGKQVIYNDIFKFNYFIAKALIENTHNPLTQDDALGLLIPKKEKYKSIIEENFKDIYYTDEENRLIDIIVQNIKDLPILKQPSAFYILFQTCLIKRPYNLFHRKNLHMRVNFNGGGFGNKVTWERTFEELFIKFNQELNEFTFDNRKNAIITNTSALECEQSADLVYIDPPYFKPKNTISYHAKYHFLEGLANYDLIEQFISPNKRNKEIIINRSEEFERPKNFIQNLDKLIEKHKSSYIVLSYRSNGIPSIKEIELVFFKYKTNVKTIDLGKFNYALSRNDKENSEFLIVGL